jgi:predicted GNAT family N-acyltransferase
MRPYLTVPLSTEHDRTAFACGSEPLDRYLRQYARQDRDRHMAQVYVCCAAETNQVVGYYTLSAYAVLRTDLPEATTKRLGRHERIPALLLGRLAVDQSQRSQGLGGRLLIDALRRAQDVATVAGAAVVVVHAKDGAAGFYEHYGFQAFVDQPEVLFLPMATVSAMLAGT